MANKNYTVDDILREYDAEGKRSGVRRKDEQPLSKGTLETEKLINAATSSRPISQRRYTQVSHAKPSTNLPPRKSVEEQIIDIKKTINTLQRENEAKNQMSGENSIVRESFPIQDVKKNTISYMDSLDKVNYHSANGNVPTDYAPPVQTVVTEEFATPVEQHIPAIQQMEDSTRAKENKKRNVRKRARSAYAEESVDSTTNISTDSKQEEDSSLQRHWEDNPETYAEKKPATKFRISGRKKEKNTPPIEMEKKKVPDDLDKIQAQTRSLHTVMMVRFLILVALTLVGAVLAFGENTALLKSMPNQARAMLHLGVLVCGILTAFPTVIYGIRNMFRLHADGDSMAVLPLIPAFFSTVLAFFAPEVLDQTSVALYSPCAILALTVNTFGRLLMVKRAMVNCKTMKRNTKKRILGFVMEQETAEMFARGINNNYPIVATIQESEKYSGFMRYAYSTDVADAVCKRYVPIYFVISVLISLGLTVLRQENATATIWLANFFSMWSLLTAMGGLTAEALVANIPLQKETKIASSTNSAMLGYQSADDYFDVNVITTEVVDLFPEGTVKINSMNVLNPSQMNDVLLDTASLTTSANSIMKYAFLDMLSEGTALREVEDFTCEEGKGISGWIANRRVLLGSKEMMLQHNIEGVPSRNREEELLENTRGDILYFSVSGVLTAIFSVEMLADQRVKNQISKLMTEKIMLVIHSIDCIVTPHSIASVFRCPERAIRILPISMENVYQNETRKKEIASTSMIVGGNGFGAADLILGSRFVRKAATRGVIWQFVAAILGFLLAMVYIIIGAQENLSSWFCLLYDVIMTFITVIAVKLSFN